MTTSEFDLEQQHLTALYAHLDALRREAAERVAAARRAGDDGATAIWRAEAARLDAVEHGLCFGRLDLHDGRRVYVGRLGLFREGGGEPLLVDWRAPAARPFYAATAVEPHGVRRRRRITTRDRVVVALDDELLDPDHAGADDLVVIGEAALLAAVTGGLREVVATLRAEQDRVVRHAHRGVLVVQGGPGTGKTAVALHRVAHLLHAHPRLRDRGVLVVGPSRVFLDHVGQVLPGLGEHAVVTTTVADLLTGVRVSRVDPPATAERKGRADLADRPAAEVRSRVREPDRPVEVEFERLVLWLDPGTCRRAVRAARRTGLPHDQAGLVFQREVVDAPARDLADLLEAVVLTDTGEAIDGGSPDGRLGEADLRALAAAGVVLDDGDGGGDDVGDDGPRTLLDETDRAALRNALLADAGVRSVLDGLWPPLTPEGVVADLLGARAAGWSAEDVLLLDEADALIRGAGARAVFGHVVVDEAQELSEMAWRAVVRRCPSRSMTVVGDLAQTGNPAGASSWATVLRPHVGDRWELAELTVNYRTPAEVMAVAADLLAAHHPELRPPRSVRSTGEPPWRVRTTDAELPAFVARIAGAHDGGPLAVIAPAARHDALAAGLPDRVALLTPGRAKGLEFDAVLVVDPAAILAGGPLGHHDLYVAMTRTTRLLGVVHPGPPPAELAAVREVER
ncbi:HelD family protein [Saccharothrix xinjiangensis]|uniref:HelD family protein n=1 Tax=Saccharothrix xinjiangensis TaxID=204798 RepID=A0ABV9Y0Y2_9PSEU